MSIPYRNYLTRTNFWYWSNDFYIELCL